MLSDQEFRDRYKPLQIPSSYSDAESEQDKIVFALASLGEADAGMVAQELHEAGYNDISKPAVAETLSGLFDMGLVGGHTENGTMKFNLIKVVEPNQGSVDPDLLSPGLD